MAPKLWTLGVIGVAEAILRGVAPHCLGNRATDKVFRELDCARAGSPLGARTTRIPLLPGDATGPSTGTRCPPLRNRMPSSALEKWLMVGATGYLACAFVTAGGLAGHDYPRPLGHRLLASIEAGLRFPQPFTRYPQVSLLLLTRALAIVDIHGRRIDVGS